MVCAQTEITALINDVACNELVRLASVRRRLMCMQRQQSVVHI